MTREEFESILEEAYNDGYNQAIEDIQEDILDEEAFDLEGEYNYYTESTRRKNPRAAQMSRAIRYGERVFGVPADDQYDAIRSIKQNNGKPDYQNAYERLKKRRNLNQRINDTSKATDFLKRNGLYGKNKEEISKHANNFVKHGGKINW
jgi:hypothetical protein